MGVDARMFVQLAGAVPSEIELRQIAARMCATIGADRFFIMRGDEPWHEGGRHALSIVKTNAGNVREDYRADYPEGFQALQGAADEAPVWTQDGPPIVFAPGAVLIEVHLWSRYYGEGYERGDWPTIRATAEFLEHAFPGGQVWYGGDSSGICATRFGPDERAELNEHYLSLGHDPYRQGWRGNDGKQTCDFCGGRRMNDVGGGQGRGFWECDGCGLQRVTWSDGHKRDLGRKEKFFEAERDPPTA